jgi:hypothetical protein
MIISRTRPIVGSDRVRYTAYRGCACVFVGGGVGVLILWTHPRIAPRQKASLQLKSWGISLLPLFVLCFI